MRKLLVGVLIAVFGIFALAGSANATVSWGGSYTVTAKLTSAGIDVSGSLGVTTYLTWGATSKSEEAGKVTLALGWTFGANNSLSVSSAEFNGKVLYLGYFASAYDFTSSIFDPNAGRDLKFTNNDYLAMQLQSFKSLKLVYIDLVDDEANAATNFFDDGIAALFNQELGVGSLSAGAVYYMNAGAGYAAAFADFTGSGALENFALSFAYKQETSNWALDASYSKTFGIVTVAPEFAYDDGSSWFGQSAKAAITVSSKLGDSLTLKLETTPEYNLANSKFSEDLNVTLGYALKKSEDKNMFDVTTVFEMSDFVSAPNAWTVNVDSNVYPMDSLTLSAHFDTDNNMSSNWNVSASYTVEEGLTAKAEYKSTGDWDATLSYSASF